MGPCRRPSRDLSLYLPFRPPISSVLASHLPACLLAWRVDNCPLATRLPIDSHYPSPVVITSII